MSTDNFVIFSGDPWDPVDVIGLEETQICALVVGLCHFHSCNVRKFLLDFIGCFFLLSLCECVQQCDPACFQYTLGNAIHA